MEQSIQCRACNSNLTADNKINTVSHQFQNRSLSYDLYRCPLCSFEFWWPMEQPPVEFYQHMYADFGRLDDKPSSKDAAYFLKFVSKREGHLLDIGCGHGAFLGKLPKTFELWGIDPIPEAITKIKKLYNIDHAYAKSLDDFASQPTPPKFDIVTTFNVLEHAGDPKLFFENVKKLLAPDSLFVFSIPDAKKYSAWQKLHNIPPNQFSWWNKKSLEFFLKNQGFSDVTIKSLGAMHPQDVFLGFLVKWFGYRKKLNFADYASISSSEWGLREKKSWHLYLRVLAKKFFGWLHPVSKFLAFLGIGRNHFFVIARLNSSF